MSHGRQAAILEGLKQAESAVAAAGVAGVACGWYSRLLTERAGVFCSLVLITLWRAPHFEAACTQADALVNNPHAAKSSGSLLLAGFPAQTAGVPHGC